MCKSIESYAQEYAREYAQEYAKERERENTKLIIQNLLLENDGYSIEKIARLCNTSVDFVKEVQEEFLTLT